MSSSDENVIRNLLDEALFYATHTEENESYENQSIKTLDQVDELLNKNIQQSFQYFSAETFVIFAEVALVVKNKDQRAEYYMAEFFTRLKQSGQMYVRALLVQAQIVARKGLTDNLKAEESIKNMLQALSYIQKAIEIILKPENKQKYAFLIYNASVTVYNIIRMLLVPSWQKNFTEIVEKIDKMLEEADEPDYNWRCRFTWVLFHCLYDNEKKQEAFKLFDKLWETTRKKGDCEFQDLLFRLRIHFSKENSAYLNIVKKDADTAQSDKAWKQLLTLQMIKSGLIPEAQVEKELISVINSISTAVLSGNELPAGATKISSTFQERLAEISRIAIAFNKINIAEALVNFLGKVRQLSQKAYILLEYSKGELQIKKAGPVIDSNTGMRLNPIQLKKQEIQRRLEALNILDKVLITNKKLNDPELIYEGCILIWNISLPFLNKDNRNLVNKPFVNACNLLEQIQSTDYQLRVNFHFEIAKNEIEADFLVKAETHLKKALQLDPSKPLNKLQIQPAPGEDSSLYQRPYERYLQTLKNKVVLKQNIYAEPKNELERVILDLENVYTSKSENLQTEILQKCFAALFTMSEQEFYNDPALDLVQEEIEQAQIKHKQQNLAMQKQRKLIAGEIAKLAFDRELTELCIKACEYVINDQWETKNANEMILIQIECKYILAQCYIEMLLKENYEIAFQEPIKIIDEDFTVDRETEEIPQAKLDQILERKKLVIQYFSHALKLAENLKQSWLVFNGAIYIWNNFLPVFRNPINDDKLLQDIPPLLKEYFEVMRISLKELESKQITDYDLDGKIQVFANIGIIYARLMENKSFYDEVLRICEALLLTPLTPHTRKLVNSIKVRVSGVAKSSNIKQPDKSKGGEKGTVVVQDNKQIIYEVVAQLEIIQNNSNKAILSDLIKKCFDTLIAWKVQENDENELELHAELWARLARLALMEGSQSMLRVALNCVENSLSLLKEKNDLNQIPPTRLRWYSLAEYLYADTLVKMVNPETQERESQEKLYFHALKHSLEAANKGCKANINVLVLDAAKQFWNITTKVHESAVNRKTLIKPIFSLMYYLKTCKEIAEPDLILLLCQVFFQAALENEEHKLGENLVDMAFELIPKNLQKPLWEAKMIFMSKQGKNELQAISNMKEADSSLQAKVWLKLARNSASITKQFTAYNKAIEILRKENSVEVVEIYIEFAEWLLRNGYEVQLVQDNLLIAADILIDIEIDEEEDEEEEDDDNKAPSILSRSSRGKKSQISMARSKISQVKSKKSQLTKAKKYPDQKSVTSKVTQQSKQNSGSRMSRASHRGTKTIKTKQSKSIFTERENEPYPETLNCSHYERLLRIHAILATLSPTNEELIRYCLDSKFFALKIVELTLKTLNSIEESSAKLTLPKDQDKIISKNLTAVTGQRYKMPDKMEEWIQFQAPQLLLERCKTSEDANIMSRFAFEKAELTYNYVTVVITFLQNVGLHIHTIPLHFFARFLSKEIIQSSYLTQLSELRYIKMLYQLGLNTEANLSLQSLQMSRIKIPDYDKRILLSKLESSVIKPKNNLDNTTNQNVEQTVVKPLIIKEITFHQVWTFLARELLQFGEVNKARLFLNEAVTHAKIANDYEFLAELEHLRAEIALLEGQTKIALESEMIAHKLAKSVLLWERIAPITLKGLKQFKKTSDEKLFIDRLVEVFEETHEEGGGQVPQYPGLNKLYSLGTFLLLQATLILREAKNNQSYDKFKESITVLEKFEKLTKFTGITVNHAKLIIRYASKLLKFAERLPSFTKEDIIFAFKMAEKCSTRLLLLETHIVSNLRYIHTLPYDTKISGPLTQIYAESRILLARSFILQGSLKQTMRSTGIHLGSEQQQQQQQKKNQLLADDIQNTQELPQFLQKYLLKLTLKIEKQAQPVPVRLDSFEKALALLRSIYTIVPQDSIQYYQSIVHSVQAKRLRAAALNKLGEIWPSTQKDNSLIDDYQDKNSEELNEMQHVDLKSESLSSALESVKNKQLKDSLCDPLIQGSIAFYYSVLLQEQIIENIGEVNPEVCFEYLTQYQNEFSLEFLWKLAKQSSCINYRPFLLKKLINKVHEELYNYELKEMVEMLRENKFSKFFSEKLDFKADVLTLLPKNTAYLIVQMTPNMEYLYLGFLHVTSEGKKNYIAQRYNLEPSRLDQIRKLQDKFNQMRSSLAKTPLMTKLDEQKLEEENDKIYNEQLLPEFLKLFNFMNTFLEGLLNPEIIKETQVVEQEIQTNNNNKGGKAAAAPPQKKPDKNEPQTYENPLGGTSNGIQCFVWLIDQRLQPFPWEAMSALRNIPAVCRDFSMNILAKRMKNVSYNPESNNSSGISKDKLTYVIYEFTEDKNDVGVRINPTDLYQKGIPNCKVSGVGTKTRIPSLGEWQQYVNNSSTLFYYGNPPFLNILSPGNIIDILETNTIKSFFVMDRLNCRKTILNKYSSLDPDAEKVLIQEQPFKSAALLTLIGASFLMLSNWSIKPEETCKAISSINRVLSEDLYMGAVLKYYKEDEKLYYDKDGKLVLLEEYEANNNVAQINNASANKDKNKKTTKKDQVQTPAKLEDEKLLEDLREEKIPRKNFYKDSFMLFGMPMLRLSQS